MSKTKTILISFLLLFTGFLGAQEIERWILTHPNNESEILPDRIGGNLPQGTRFRVFFERDSPRLKRFCLKYLKDIKPAKDRSNRETAKFREISKLHQELLQAALAASLAAELEVEKTKRTEYNKQPQAKP